MTPGTFIISLDFELHWGRFDKAEPLASGKYYYEARQSIPDILTLFERFGIKATWSTVGMLFAENREEWLTYVPEELPTFVNPKFSAYHWYRDHPHIPELFLFAPDLIAEILSVHGQEIGSHTYSHYYTGDAGQTKRQFRADLAMAKKIAWDKFQINLSSLVFPRNQINPCYLPVCRDLGFQSVRTNPKQWFWQETWRESWLKKTFRTADTLVAMGTRTSYPLEALVQREELPLQIPASRFLRPHRPSPVWLNGWRLSRIMEEMTLAARLGEAYHLWWHPHNFGHHPRENHQDLKKILLHFVFLKEAYGMRSESMESLSRVVLSVGG